jgi:hypothetical protein
MKLITLNNNSGKEAISIVALEPLYLRRQRRGMRVTPTMIHHGKCFLDCSSSYL